MSEDTMPVAPRPNRKPPAPPVGPELAQQMRFSSAEYQQARSWFQFLWERHLQTQQPGSPGRLTAEDKETFLRPAAADANELLAAKVGTELDPALARGNADLVEAERTIGELQRWGGRDVAAGGRTWTLAEADAESRRLSLQIQLDTEAGHLHHQRAPRVLHRLSDVLMVLDLLAIVAIFIDLFNVDFDDLVGSLRELLAAIFLPIILLTVQLFAARFAGKRWNEYREFERVRNAIADEARRKLQIAAALAALVVLPLTLLLVLRLWSIATDVNLGLAWRFVLCLIGLAIGIGAPLMKARVVAEDGSTESRLRDELEAALGRERAAAEAAARHAQTCLDAARQQHEDYAARLRPRVLHAAGGPLVAAENALGLLNVMLGAAGPGTTRPRQHPATAVPEAPSSNPGAATGAAVSFPPLRWSSEDAPDLDNQPLAASDRTYAEQRGREAQLRGLLAEVLRPTGWSVQVPRAALVAEPVAAPAARAAGELTAGGPAPAGTAPDSSG